MTRIELLKKHKYKIAALFISVFCITCLNLCAEEMSLARAQTCRQNLVTEAKKYIGCPYVYGAAGPDTFDCSGLIYYISREVNKTQLPRTAKALYEKAKLISDDERQPGDLVFFKTTSSGYVSHVGIYIGNNQFISAVSDGPNTGVILSSINEGYWKPRYCGAGQIYKPTKALEEIESDNTKVAVAEKTDTTTKEDSETKTESSETTVSYEKKPKSGNLGYFDFLQDIIIDTTLCGNWSFMDSDSVNMTFRGLDLSANARVGYRKIQPGIGLGLRWNYWMDLIQFPITISLSINDYLRFYAGPVLSIGKGITKDTLEYFSPSIFPGIIGMTVSTPALKGGKLAFQLIQDISFSYFNNPDNSAPNFIKAVGSGLTFSTGLRITLPEF